MVLPELPYDIIARVMGISTLETSDLASCSTVSWSWYSASMRQQLRSIMLSQAWDCTYWLDYLERCSIFTVASERCAFVVKICRYHHFCSTTSLQCVQTWRSCSPCKSISPICKGHQFPTSHRDQTSSMQILQLGSHHAVGVFRCHQSCCGLTFVSQAHCARTCLIRTASIHADNHHHQDILLRRSSIIPLPSAVLVGV